jgi:hypothetical protein
MLLETCGSRGAELPLASVDVVIVERRTNHEVNGSRAGDLPSRVVATRPGPAASPGVVRQGFSGANEKRKMPDRLKGEVNG